MGRESGTLKIEMYKQVKEKKERSRGSVALGVEQSRKGCGMLPAIWRNPTEK